MDETHDEALAALRAQMDQAVASMGEIARASRAFFLALVDEGFSEREAMTLTTTWLATMLTAGTGE